MTLMFSSHLPWMMLNPFYKPLVLQGSAGCICN